MEHAPDLGVTFSSGQGCCGKAVRDRTFVFGDLAPFSGGSYDRLVDPRDGLPLWGLTPAQWAATRDLEAIVSVPLYDAHAGPDDVVGVFNVDSQHVNLNTWLPDAKARNELVARIEITRSTLEYALLEGQY